MFIYTFNIPIKKDTFLFKDNLIRVFNEKFPHSPNPECKEANGNYEMLLRFKTQEDKNEFITVLESLRHGI